MLKDVWADNSNTSIDDVLLSSEEDSDDPDVIESNIVEREKKEKEKKVAPKNPKVNFSESQSNNYISMDALPSDDSSSSISD